jgi:hypothetical protein
MVRYPRRINPQCQDDIPDLVARRSDKAGGAGAVRCRFEALCCGRVGSLLGETRRGEPFGGVCDRRRGHILATIWPQLQLTALKYCDVFPQVVPILASSAGS